jgi:hypothetical protein
MIITTFETLLFLLGFLIGFFLAKYFSSTKTVDSLIHPEPSNIHKNTYIDDNNVCYKYKLEQI